MLFFFTNRVDTNEKASNQKYGNRAGNIHQIAKSDGAHKATEPRSDQSKSKCSASVMQMNR